MTDLSEFGAGIEPADDTDDGDGEDSSPSRSYPNGRCPAINRDGKRCAAASTTMGDTDDLCGAHERQHNPVRIDHDPIRLIEATTRTLWRNFENELVREAVQNVDRRYYGGERDE